MIGDVAAFFHVKQAHGVFLFFYSGLAPPAQQGIVIVRAGIGHTVALDTVQSVGVIIAA